MTIKPWQERTTIWRDGGCQTAEHIEACMRAEIDELRARVDELEQLTYDFACGKTSGDELMRHVRSKLQAI